MYVNELVYDNFRNYCLIVFVIKHNCLVIVNVQFRRNELCQEELLPFCNLK